MKHRNKPTTLENASKEPTLRLDHFLKLSRLVPRRVLAQEICSDGAVWMNGHAVKAARLVRRGDLLEIRLRNRVTWVRILRIPELHCTKLQAAALYEQVESPHAQRFSKQ